MEVKEAIEFLGEEIRWKTNDGIKEPKGDTLKMCEVLTLLKSLESKNKKLKKENKALRKDKWELEGINEACRKENKAYRGIVEEIKNNFGNGILQNENGFGIKLEHLI